MQAPRLVGCIFFQRKSKEISSFSSPDDHLLFIQPPRIATHRSVIIFRILSASRQHHRP
jgi:hypothetical protein